MKHIQDIDIKNFKSIQHCTINGCERINIFVGPPNVGKSNILEALGLCSLIEGNSRSGYLNDYVRYETITSLFYKKNIDNQFSIIFNKNEFGLTGKVDNSSSTKQFILSHHNKKNKLINWENQLGDYILKFFLDKKLYQLKEGDLNLADDKDLNVKKMGGSNKITSFSFDNELIPPINFLKTGKIKRYQFKDNIEFKDYNTNELHIPYGENIGTFLAFQNGKLYEAIQELVAPNTFEIESNGNIRYTKKTEDSFSISFSFNEIADTLQRLIFHLTAIMSNKDSVLLFEEPESHCYEPYVLDITNAIKYDKQNNQYFIVTHSQYVVSEFLRDEASRNNTNIYLVGLDEDGATKVKLLDRDKSDDVYQYGTNVFFNYESLWNEN